MLLVKPLSASRDLSLSILPMNIKRIDSGLDGLASHSVAKRSQSKGGGDVY